MHNNESQGDDHVISYMRLRKALGIFGLLFPFILMIGGFIIESDIHIEPSISDYYYTGMRDVFVGFLISIALFLYTYRYGKKDNIAGNIAGVFAAGVAFFPCGSESELIQTLHFVSAGLLFAVLAYFSLFLFTLTHNKATRTPMKKIRDGVYKACGTIMIVCIVVLFVYFQTGIDLDRWSFVFWMETIALVAFGFSWLVKGEFILGDKL